MSDLYTCPECGLVWTIRLTECPHAITAEQVNQGIVLEPELKDGIFYDGAVAQGDGDGGGSDPTREGSSGVDESGSAEGVTSGEPIRGLAGADFSQAGRGGEDRSNPGANLAVDRVDQSSNQVIPRGLTVNLGGLIADSQIGASTTGPSGSDLGPVRSRNKDVATQRISEGDASNPERRTRFLANAERWLKGGADGQSELFDYMKLNLVVNMQYDQEEGQNVRDEESKNAAAQARANRKQFKETSELVMAIVAAQNEGKK